MWPTRPHRKHSVSALPSLPPPLWLPLPWDVVRILLRFLISKRYNCTSSLSMSSSLPASLSPTSLFQFPTAIGARPRARLLITVTVCARTCWKSGNRCCRAVDSFCQEHRRSHILGQLVSGALLMSLFKVFPRLKSARQVSQLINFCWGKDLPAVVETASGGQLVVHGGQSSPLLQAWLPFSPADCFEGSTLCPREQEMLQLLVQFHCRSKVCGVLCSDRLSLFFHSLHCLFQCWMSHTCEVSGQVRPRSPARTALLPEPIRHLILRLHQPDTCARVCLMMTPSEGRQSTCVLWIKTQVRAGPARVKGTACLWAIRPLTRPGWPFERPLAQLGAAATDLGIETAAGKRRCAASQWKRTWKGRRRAKRVNRQCKMNSEAQKLTMTGIHPVQVDGHTAQGASNAQVNAMCRSLKLGAVLGKTQACPMSTVAWFFGAKRVPQTTARVEQISEWVSLWRNCNVDTRRRIRQVWRKKAPMLANNPSL